MQVIAGADLRSGDAHGHNIEAGGSLDTQARRELDIGIYIHRLGKAVVGDEFLGGGLVGVTLGVTERVTQVYRPGRVGVHIIKVASGDIFAGDGVIVDALVRIGVASAVLVAVVAVRGALSVEGNGGRQGSVGQTCQDACLYNIKGIDALALLVDGVGVEVQVATDVQLVEQVGRGRYADILHPQGVGQEVVTGVDVQLVQDLHLLGARTGGVPQIPHLGLQVIADGKRHRGALAAAGRGSGVVVAGDAVYVVPGFGVV